MSAGAVVTIVTIAALMKVTRMVTLRSAIVAKILLLLLIVRMILGQPLLARHEDARADIGAVALDGGQQHLQLILLERLEELFAPQQSTGILLVVILAGVATAATLVQPAGRRRAASPVNHCTTSSSYPRAASR